MKREYNRFIDEEFDVPHVSDFDFQRALKIPALNYEGTNTPDERNIPEEIFNQNMRLSTTNDLVDDLNDRKNDSLERENYLDGSFDKLDELQHRELPEEEEEEEKFDICPDNKINLNRSLRAASWSAFLCLPSPGQKLALCLSRG